MPEGDTVWLAAKRMNEALGGEVLTGTDFRVPQLATTDLAGATVLEVVPRGKHLLTRMDTGLTLHTHFRMDGTWHLYRHGVAWVGGPQWQVRVVFETEPWIAVGYRMPVIELVRTDEESSVVGHLGPDVLDPAFDLQRAVENLRADPDREIGQAVLDQRNLAGIGNLYKCEALFLGHTSPWALTCDVDLSHLVLRAQKLLDLNKDRPEQATTGRLGRGEQHWVFERSGKPCRRCGTRISGAMQGPPPYERITYWCSSCQPGPHPAALTHRPAQTDGRSRYRP